MSAFEKKKQNEAAFSWKSPWRNLIDPESRMAGLLPTNHGQRA